MTERPVNPEAEQSGPADTAGGLPPVVAHEGLWHRIHEHKILQWGLGYLGAALALAHGAELLGHTFHWPEVVQRLIMGVLIVGLPLVLTLAWYHGHKGLKSVSHGELMIASILLVIGAGLLIVLVRTPSEAPEAPAAAITITTSSIMPAAPRTSIAVMPFVNLTGDASKDYLGDGMSEELINVLTKVPGLTVPSRTSSFAYKGRNTDLKQIAKDLSVGTILEGSVRSAGTTIRITAQLIDAQSDRHLWSETYDRKFTDIFKLQDDLAKAIATSLRGTVEAPLSATITQAPPTKDVEAYQLYLQARSLYWAGSEKRFRDALSMLNAAISRDPGFARAWAGRAQVRVSFATLGYPLPNALEDAKLDAERALALDANLPQALVALGTINAIHGDWIGAEKNFQAALTVEPGDASVVSDYIIFVLQSVGHLRKAETQAAEAYRLAPADRAILIDAAAVRSLMGIDADAVKFADLAVKMGYDPTVVPIPQVFANAAVRSGHFAEAAERMVSGLSPSVRDAGGAEVVKLIFAALADPSKKPAARQALRDFAHKAEISGPEIVTREDFIASFTRLGAVDDAYELANRTLDDLGRSGTVGGGWGVMWLPEMRPFRQDPRFQRFAARLKLFDYWKQYGPPDDCDLKDGKLICQ